MILSRMSTIAAANTNHGVLESRQRLIRLPRVLRLTGAKRACRDDACLAGEHHSRWTDAAVVK